MDTSNHIRTRLNEAQNILNEIAGMIDPPAQIHSPDQIIQVICDEFTITESDLKGKSKKGDLCYARPLWCLLLFSHVTDNKTSIAKMMNRESHWTTINLLRLADSLQTNKIFKARQQSVKERLFALHFNPVGNTFEK